MGAGNLPSSPREWGVSLVDGEEILTSPVGLSLRWGYSGGGLNERNRIIQHRRIDNKISL